MKPLKFAALCLALVPLAGCVAPTGPVEVTRFHVPDVSPLGKGTISVEPAPGMDGASIEWRTYQMAVQRQLTLTGYSGVPAGTGAQVAELRFTRGTYQPDRSGSPVSVGVGGSTGSYGSGLGVGIGLNLSPKPTAQVESMLGVVIKDRMSGQALWEGRASFSVRASSPLADTTLSAGKLAEALFQGFPGQSGETISVK
ncbi:DUF4136 domain-containing protein [Novosphingobium sp.]|uniref:DUF4136 domain-containing protein n=1 Tax=Novosphingobium sp. TaxID=1874826 RepID=UPI00273497C2|nr:DUF4136 domain-containing protein [Novosphingobium sp.]MDP3905891.1 DUF4136 domain-containing protein [Novosphingobium sp.]